MPGLPGFALVVCLAAGPARAKPLVAAEAVRLAEKFVLAQGYTAAPPSVGADHVVSESLKSGSNPREWLKHRRGTLRRHAYGFLRGRKSGQVGWTVVFRMAGTHNTETGRAVTMDPDGRNPRVEHVDIFLKAVETKL